MNSDCKNNISLSIIICTYQRSVSLRKTLDEIFNQIANICSIDIEVIVVDNNSLDSTAITCNTYAKLYDDKFIYLHEKKQGKSHALNNAIKNARGHLLLFTDDDVIPDSSWVSAVIRAFEVKPECDAFGGKILPLLHEGVTMPSWVRQKEPHYNAEGPLGDHNKGDYVKSYYEPDMGTPCGANFFVRRKVFEEHGLYNENLNIAVKNLPMAEDSEFCFRLKKNNIPILYIPDAVVYHDTPAEKLTKGYFRRYICRMSRAYVHAAKVEKGTKRIFNIPRFFIRIVIERFITYTKSVITNESVDYEFSKQLELLQSLAICFWYFADRNLLNND